VKTGVFAGHCATYCGLYHSEMLFSVAVVSPNAFGSWLKAQSSSGATA
jgi:cytochrome c oxidase subunit 2